MTSAGEQQRGEEQHGERDRRDEEAGDQRPRHVDELDVVVAGGQHDAAQRVVDAQERRVAAVDADAPARIPAVALDQQAAAAAALEAECDRASRWSASPASPASTARSSP